MPQKQGKAPRVLLSTVISYSDSGKQELPPPTIMERYDMKTQLLAFALLAAVSGQAAAADHDWTGGYVGLNFSHNNGSSRADLTPSGQWSVETPQFTTDVFNAWSTDLDPKGNGWGVQGGYDHQFSNHWVWGVSADYSRPKADDSRLTAQTAVPSSPAITYSYGNSVNAKSAWGLHTRLGYGAGNSLFYLTAGWKSVDVEGTAEILGANGYSKFGKGSDSVSGLTYGLGWEYAFNDNWSLQAEYQRAKLGDFSYTTDYRAGSTFTTPAYIETVKQDLDLNTFSIGINYRF